PLVFCFGCLLRVADQLDISLGKIIHRALIGSAWLTLFKVRSLRLSHKAGSRSQCRCCEIPLMKEGAMFAPSFARVVTIPACADDRFAFLVSSVESELMPAVSNNSTPAPLAAIVLQCW